MRKRFRFDPATLVEVEGLWNDCKTALDGDGGLIPVISDEEGAAAA
jgi:hypothetical protein